jgi:hypothetical protein
MNMYSYSVICANVGNFYFRHYKNIMFHVSIVVRYTKDNNTRMVQETAKAKKALGLYGI